MTLFHTFKRCRPWLTGAVAAFLFLGTARLAPAADPPAATQPAPTLADLAKRIADLEKLVPAAPATSDKDQTLPLTMDPSGATGATAKTDVKKGDPLPTPSLLAPNSGTGLSTGTMKMENDPKYDKDKKTGQWTFKPYAGDHPTVDENAQNIVRAHYAINMTWTLVCGFLVMFMQAGFALVETGLIRGKNAAHTMAMNFMVYALGMFGFFVCGFAFMCGGANGTSIGGPGQLGGVPNLDTMYSIGAHVTQAGVEDGGWGLFGHTGWFLTGKGYDGASAVWFLFMMVFMDTTATIVTGACAERWSFKSFCVFSVLIGGFIYPIFGSWVWGGGWLAQMGYRWGLGHGACDYAGSGVVHLQGGALAFITALLIGPRLGKYNKEGKVVNPIAAHNIPMVMLGSFILAFGWFGFNPGSSLAAMDGRIGIIATNTMLAGMSATLSNVLFMWLLGPTKKPDPGMMCNGLLAGLVAITAPCAFVSPCGAFWIGAVAGVLVCASVFFFDKIRVDDPVGAISVHGANGAWGVLAVGLFADGQYGTGYNAVWDSPVTGLFYGGGVKQLMSQAIEVGVCVGWNVIIGGILFIIVGKLVGGNRVSAKVEIAGLDMPEMGALGYPVATKHILPEDVTDSEVEAIKAGKKLEPDVAMEPVGV
jgi:Amt family ammonium transporter